MHSVGIIRVCGLYRPPQKSIPAFIDFIEQVLNENCAHKCCFLGDMNINTLVSNNFTHRYNNIMHSFSMKNSIKNISTFVQPNSDNNSGSCLDHIWHNIDTGEKSYVLHPALSDHKPCVVVFGKVGLTHDKLNIRFRDISFENKRMCFYCTG